MYDKANDPKGRRMTETKLQELEKNISTLKKKKSALKMQVYSIVCVFLGGSTDNDSVASSTASTT
jgi:hypothetical protein